PTRDELEASLTSKDKFEGGRSRVLLASLGDRDRPDDAYFYTVQTWRLGNDGPFIAALGGEVTVDYALRLKFELGAGRTWVLGYSNDVMAYIPSRRVLFEGGYEGGGAMVYYGLPGPWRPEVEENIVAEVHRQAESLGLEKLDDYP